MTATIDQAVMPDAGDRRLSERLHRLEETVTRANRERDAARAEAAAQQWVSQQLQAHLDEYNADRRAYEQRIADLEAENERLRGMDTLELPKYVPTRRGGWRRSR